MTSILLVLFLLAGIAGPYPAPERHSQADSSLRVMTFNIRYDNPGDGSNAWPYRKDMVARVIRYHEADLVGVQEALRHQLDALTTYLPGWEWFGVGRADGAEAGEYSAILYRTDRLERLDGGTFWLSQTPDAPGSKSWDAAIERIATWAKFRDRRSGETFFHFNTHFDHIGAEARAESARLILERIAALAGDAPVVLTGDVNATDETLPYRILTGQEEDTVRGLRDAFRAVPDVHRGPTSTWNGFEAIVPGRRIDYVFVSDRVRVLQHEILADAWDGRFPSDHLPVLAEVVVD